MSLTPLQVRAFPFFDINMSKWSRVGSSYERPLGDSEYAFFPASQNALGDM